MQPDFPEATDPTSMTLEAFADTIIPGEKRHRHDHAVAGVSAGGGAVASGALELLRHPAGGLADSLDGLAMMLNGHTQQYAAERGLALADDLPPFVALAFADRTALVAQLTGVDHPEKALWVGMALFSNMAFDSAAHLSTPDALRDGHPGLLSIGYTAPDADGAWRFPRFSYGRALADIHPNTTPTGSPA
ncbi:DUF5987 family protein [Catellatospora coxensis]|uniref:Uncharacterized protein n=2 Tax=Catellatospora coxensis TaxID=310354 RepID=A0A8J3L2H2_9ACTN|nr:hypothetical protein Cco03nite_73030 [Catellatospora coxensis]